jgi:hypothetical protein
MPGIYKIGRTDRAPRDRMEELSRSTSVPFDFELVLYAQVDDSVAAEANIHKALRKKRCNTSREFFRASLEEIRSIINDDEHTCDICDVEFDLMVWHEQQAEEARFPVDHFLSQSHDPIHWETRRGFEGFE